MSMKHWHRTHGHDIETLTPNSNLRKLIIWTESHVSDSEYTFSSEMSMLQTSVSVSDIDTCWTHFFYHKCRCFRDCYYCCYGVLNFVMQFRLYWLDVWDLKLIYEVTCLSWIWIFYILNFADRGVICSVLQDLYTEMKELVPEYQVCMQLLVLASVLFLLDELLHNICCFTVFNVNFVFVFLQLHTELGCIIHKCGLHSFRPCLDKQLICSL